MTKMLENDNIENSTLSKDAREMLLKGKRVNTINYRYQIEKLFGEKDLPSFERVIEFQEKYGGICYKIGKSFYHGYSMNIVYFNELRNKYEFKYIKKEKESYFFECMEYHFAGDFGPCIDQDGKIYSFAMGSFFIRADSIEEFLEDEAIKYGFVNKQYRWLNRGATYDDFQEFKKNKSLSKIENKFFTGKYFEWWKDDNDSIFIRVNLLHKYTYAEVYCKNEETLYGLYKESKPSHIYPSEY